MSQIQYSKNFREGKHLKYEERQNIEYWKNKLKKSNKEIAILLGRSERTIRRELKRGTIIKWNERKLDFLPIYSAKEAQEKYEYHKTGKGPHMILDVNIELSKHVEEQILKYKKSPEVIVIELEKYGFAKGWLCAKTIRNAVYNGNIFTKIKPGQIIYNKKKRKTGNKKRQRSKKTPPERSIEYRSEEINTREEYGHWEGDLVEGKRKIESKLLVLTERKTREEIILKIPNKKKESVKEAFDKLEKEFKEKFKEKFKTITFDNGSEFNDYEELEKSVRTKGKRFKVYYAHPYSSWERGSNENNNRFIRRFYPKGTSLKNITEEEIKYIENWINNYPRQMFNYKSTNEILKEILTVSR